MHCELYPISAPMVACRHSKPSANSVSELAHNNEFESSRVARTWFTQRLRLVFTRTAPPIGHKIFSYQSEPDISGGGEGVGLFASSARHLTLLVVRAFLFILIHFNISLSCPRNTLANCLLIQCPFVVLGKFVLEETVLGTQAVTPALFAQYSCWHLRECSVGCIPGTYLLYHQLHF